MELAARPLLTATVAFSAVGLLAVTPVASVVPEVQIPEIHLTAIADDIGDGIAGFNGFLVDGLLDANQALVAGQIGLEAMISGPFSYLPDFLAQHFNPDNILNGALNRSYNVFNMGLDAAQQGLLGVLGADGSDLTEALTAGLNNGTNPVFATGDIGGLQGMFGNALKVLDNLIGFPGTAAMDGLETGIDGANGSLVEGLTGLNQWLVAGQLGLQDAVFGTEHAFNGVLNRGFDAFNALLGAGQRGILGVLGADFSTITESLSLVPLQGGHLGDLAEFPLAGAGGLQGVLGHSYMLLANLIGGLVNSDGLFGVGGLLEGLNLFNVFNPADLFGAFDPVPLLLGML